jgi:6-phosphogluconolactonase
LAPRAWGDKRCVPPDHAESNYRMVQEALLSRISIPAANIHRMAGEKEPRVAGTSTKRSYAASLL